MTSKHTVPDLESGEERGVWKVEGQRERSMFELEGLCILDFGLVRPPGAAREHLQEFQGREFTWGGGSPHVAAGSLPFQPAKSCLIGWRREVCGRGAPVVENQETEAAAKQMNELWWMTQTGSLQSGHVGSCGSALTLRRDELR